MCVCWRGWGKGGLQNRRPLKEMFLPLSKKLSDVVRYGIFMLKGTMLSTNMTLKSENKIGF